MGHSARGTELSSPTRTPTEDKCLKGEERHNEECLKESTISGEACATVAVTVPYEEPRQFHFSVHAPAGPRWESPWRKPPGV